MNQFIYTWRFASALFCLSKSQDIESFYDEYFEWQVRSKPFKAYIGGVQFDDLNLPNHTLSSYEEYFQTARLLRAKLNYILLLDGNKSNRYTDAIKFELDSIIENYKYKGYLLASISIYSRTGLLDIPNIFKSDDKLR